MEKMIYKPRYEHGKEHVLWQGDVDGLEAAIVSYGTHPCAYINLTDEIIEKIKEEGYDESAEEYMFYDIIDAYPHGGFTFYGHLTCLGDGDRWAGWDYAHCDDYTYDYLNGLFDRSDEKRWTTEEILEEVKEVVAELKENYGI